MSAITLWGRKNSANVQKVIWALEELGLPYEHVPLGGNFGGLDAVDYRALNPNGLIPTLRDEGLVVWESHAILRYLSARYAEGTLWPIDPAERAVVDQWTDWTATMFQPAWIKVFWQVIRTAPEDQDPSEIARSIADTSKLLAIMDARLAKSRFLAGDHLTYADMAAGAAFYRWYSMEIERPDFEHVRTYYNRLLQRAAYCTAIVANYAQLRAKPRISG